MRLAVALIGLAFAAGCVAPSVRAAPDISYGIQDDAWLAHGPGSLDDRLDQLEALGVDIVRVNLHWDQIEPTQGSYAWDDADEVLQALHGRGIPAVVGLVGSPPWANGGKASNFVPTASRFAGFAREAAERYPWVRDWLIWNEPNQTRWLRPTSPAVYVAHLLNPAYRAIHDVTPGAKVAGGVTAPRAGAGGVSPVAWIRGMRRAGARLDAYAHHPYPARPTETPLAGGCAHCSTITMATLGRLLTEVKRAWGGKRIWLTEYGYQTDPPDRVSGVSQLLQARYLAEGALRAYRAPRVDMLIQYLVRDEPSLGRWQSGLFLFSGRPKLSATEFPLPLVQAGRSGDAAVLWGQVRPGKGVQSYRLEARSAGESWRWLGGTRRTTPRGFVSVRIDVPRGTQVRLWSAAADSEHGVTIVVR